VDRRHLAGVEQAPGQLVDDALAGGRIPWPMPVSERLSSKRTMPGVADGFSSTVIG
jgi:hypothetical protein